MNEAHEFFGLISIITVLTESDVCTGWPGFPRYAARQAAHIAIGATLGGLALTGRTGATLAVTALGILLGKEIFADIPNCGFARHVIADSLADVAAYGLGLATARMAFRGTGLAGLRQQPKSETPLQRPAQRR